MPKLPRDIMVADIVRMYTDLGYGYSATTGLVNAATGTNNYPLALWNPNNSGRTLFVYSIQASNGSGGQTAFLQMVRTNPNFPSAITPINQNPGSSISSVASLTTTTTSQTLSGSHDQVTTLASTTLELLTNGAVIELEPNNGLVVYMQTYGAAINSLLMRWVEL